MQLKDEFQATTDVGLIVGFDLLALASLRTVTEESCRTTDLKIL